MRNFPILVTSPTIQNCKFFRHRMFFKFNFTQENAWILTNYSTYIEKKNNFYIKCLNFNQNYVFFRRAVPGGNGRFYMWSRLYCKICHIPMCQTVCGSPLPMPICPIKNPDFFPGRFDTSGSMITTLGFRDPLHTRFLWRGRRNWVF